MLRKSARTKKRHHGPFLILLLAAACEPAAAPMRTVELTGLTRMVDGRPVSGVNVVVVRMSGLMPMSIVAHTVSDSTGSYSLIYDAADPMTCGRYFAAAGRKLKLGELAPGLGARVPCTEGVHRADFLLTGADTLP